jgi:hypothetical protein
MNPHLDPLNVDTALSFKIFSGIGVNSSPIFQGQIDVANFIGHYQPNSYPIGYLNVNDFATINISSVDFSVGSYYTFAISDDNLPTSRWGALMVNGTGFEGYPEDFYLNGGALYADYRTDLTFYVSPVSPELLPPFPNSNPVPLPASLWLLGSGLLGLAGWRRFRKG